jgi:hypothetical protein
VPEEESLAAAFCRRYWTVKWMWQLAKEFPKLVDVTTMKAGVGGTLPL